MQRYRPGEIISISKLSLFPHIKKKENQADPGHHHLPVFPEQQDPREGSEHSVVH